jgi:hypothetical protein
MCYKKRIIGDVRAAVKFARRIGFTYTAVVARNDIPADGSRQQAQACG